MSNIVPFKSGGSGGGGDLRSPPSSLAAEGGVLGSILMDNRAYDQVAGFLDADHFYAPLNARIYSVIASLIEKGETVNPVTIAPYLAADELFDQAGGMKYLTGLIMGLVSRDNAASYGKVVYDAFIRRETIDIGYDMMERSFAADPDVSAETVLDAIEQRIFELAALGTRQDSAMSAGEAAKRAVEIIQAAYRRGDGVTGTPTGLRDLDAKVAGLHPSDLFILAGRPGMGKTSLALTIAVNAARYFRDTDRPEDKGKQVVFFSLEMSGAQLALRLASAFTGIDHHRIRGGRITADEAERLMNVEAEIAALPLVIDEQPAASVSAIRVRCRRLWRKSKKPVGLCVVDYLQLIAPPPKKGEQNRVQEVSAITAALKGTAKSLRIPILALSQLSRALEQREDKRPQLSDLRESGSIEQDADEVAFVYREQYYLERAEPKRRADESDERFGQRLGNWTTSCLETANRAEIIIAKQRHGPVGMVSVHFDGARMWFSDLERVHADHADPAPQTPAARAAAEQVALDLGDR